MADVTAKDCHIPVAILAQCTCPVMMMRMMVMMVMRLMRQMHNILIIYLFRLQFSGQFHEAYPGLLRAILSLVMIQFV